MALYEVIKWRINGISIGWKIELEESEWKAYWPKYLKLLKDSKNKDDNKNKGSKNTDNKNNKNNKDVKDAQNKALDPNDAEIKDE